MSILTNFLKLVKPEKNDYVDVEEHISNNLDKIDEKMENFNLNKLDKGGYTGTAQNLLTEISKIASKTVLGRIIVGKGLTVDSSGRTSVVSKNDAIIVNDNDIQLNVYDGVDSTSTTRAASARAVKMAYDKGVEGLNKADTKLDAGSVSTEYDTAKKIEDKIKEKIDKKAIINDLTTGGTDKVGSAEMVKKLGKDKQDKTDSGLQTNSKEVVGAINEVIPSKYDQVFSPHYFHKLYQYDGVGNRVYEHIYPGPSSIHKGLTIKVERFGTDDNSPYMELLKTGNADIYFKNTKLGSSYIYQQKNIGNITELWVNSSTENNIANRTIVLNENWDRFQTLVFEICNVYKTTKEVDYSYIYLETSLLRTNNTATADNEHNDYHLLYFNGQYGYKTVYFRDDKRSIWLSNIINWNDEPIRLKRVIGLNRKVGAI